MNFFPLETRTAPIFLVSHAAHPSPCLTPRPSIQLEKKCTYFSPPPFDSVASPCTVPPPTAKNGCARLGSTSPGHSRSSCKCRDASGNRCARLLAAGQGATLPGCGCRLIRGGGSAAPLRWGRVAQQGKAPPSPAAAAASSGAEDAPLLPDGGVRRWAVCGRFAQRSGFFGKSTALPPRPSSSCCSP
jgi:hypothetical protein